MLLVAGGNTGRNYGATNMIEALSRVIEVTAGMFGALAITATLGSLTTFFLSLFYVAIFCN